MLHIKCHNEIQTQSHWWGPRCRNELELLSSQPTVLIPTFSYICSSITRYPRDTSPLLSSADVLQFLSLWISATCRFTQWFVVTDGPSTNIHLYSPNLGSERCNSHRNGCVFPGPCGFLMSWFMNVTGKVCLSHHICAPPFNLCALLCVFIQLKIVLWSQKGFLLPWSWQRQGIC